MNPKADKNYKNCQQCQTRRVKASIINAHGSRENALTVQWGIVVHYGATRRSMCELYETRHVM
jgi:hypothetical protein